MILVSEDWIGASVNQTLTGALSALQRLPWGCGYGADVTSLGVSSLGVVLCESPVTTAHPQNQKGAGLNGKLSGSRHFSSSGAPSEGKTAAAQQKRIFLGWDDMMVRPRLSTLSVTQPSGRGSHSAVPGHPEPNRAA